MTTSDREAREGIVSLLFDLPDNVKDFHSNCTLDMCGAKRLRRDNPGISEEDLVKLYDSGTRFHGEILSVTDEGVKELSSFITKRITAKNADAIARMESTGKIESSNAEAAVLIGGKRLNMTQTTHM
mmetsp:Transcript_25683/g.74288  ORF Transcript_25683/g.74288 Transcript_25683/m.74288 type:complete len:127 (+) Transcript_25683:98-478(+)